MNPFFLSFDLRLDSGGEEELILVFPAGTREDSNDYDLP